MVFPGRRSLPRTGHSAGQRAAITTGEIPAIDITDIVRTLNGERVRVSGFYRLARTRGGLHYLQPCLPDDEGLVAIGTYAYCSELHRPWEVEYLGPVAWSAGMIADERASWRSSASQPDPELNERDYPGLLHRFTSLSAHERIRLARWRAEQAQFHGEDRAPW